MGDVLHQLDDAFAGAAFAGEQPDLIERHAVPDRPLALRDRLAVPVRHVEPLQRLGRRCAGLCRAELVAIVLRVRCRLARIRLVPLLARAIDQVVEVWIVGTTLAVGRAGEPDCESDQL